MAETEGPTWRTGCFARHPVPAAPGPLQSPRPIRSPYRTSSARSRPRPRLLTPPPLIAGNLDITPDDPRWIGAWWGGFLLCGALLFFSSLLMFGFPQSLPPHSDPAMESEQAMLPEREYERPKPSNGVLRHPLEPDSSASCFQQLRGEDASSGGGQSAGGIEGSGVKGGTQTWVLGVVRRSRLCFA